MKNQNRRHFLAISAAGVLGANLASPANAASRRTIDRRVRYSLELIEETFPNLIDYINSAAGILIIPRVRRLGVGFGLAYGEGALLIGRAPVEYYSVGAASFGLQFGIHQYASAIFFETEKALHKFRSRDGWTMGADIEYTMIKEGEIADIDTNTSSDEIYGIVYNREGIHIGITLEGSKYTRIVR